MKKFISLMLLFAMASFSWAQDVEEEEEEEEVVEVVKPKAAKAVKKSGGSKIGLQIAYMGELEGIRVVYDMGTGLRLKLGADLTQGTTTSDSQDADGNPIQVSETKTVIELNVGGDYLLGTKLLPYGVALDIDYNNETKGYDLFPSLFTEVELVKNLSLGLQAGLSYEVPAEKADPVIGLETRGLITFYFM